METHRRWFLAQGRTNDRREFQGRRSGVVRSFFLNRREELLDLNKVLLSLESFFPLFLTSLSLYFIFKSSFSQLLLILNSTSLVLYLPNSPFLAGLYLEILIFPLISLLLSSSLSLLISPSFRFLYTFVLLVSSASSLPAHFFILSVL